MTSIGDVLDGGNEVDGDSLFIAGTTWFVMDADPSAGGDGTYMLWDVDLATAVASARRTAAASIHGAERVGGDWYVSVASGPLTRHLARMDPETGALTDIGPTHSASDFGGNPLTSLALVPVACAPPSS